MTLPAANLLSHKKKGYLWLVFQVLQGNKDDLTGLFEEHNFDHNWYVSVFS